VTTNRIAGELDISPGNLHYHFRHKQDIVLDLYQRFERAIGEVMGAAEHDLRGVEDLWLYVHLTFEQIQTYRFLFRDQRELVAVYPALRPRIQRQIERGLSLWRLFLGRLNAARALALAHDELEALALNMAVVSTYWFELEGVRAAGTPAASGESGRAAARGVFQVLSLLAPHLRGRTRQSFRALALRYIAEH
jgi:AcrR family transcriptional regulator